jgi:hypothetical protein
VAEAEKPPAEAADVVIELDNKEDPQYTVCGLHLSYVDWEGVSGAFSGVIWPLRVFPGDILAVSGCRCCTCRAPTGLACSRPSLLL